MKKNYDQTRQRVKKQRHYFANKCLSSPGYGFSSSHLWMWELDYKESWALKNWCFWTMVLEKTLESPLNKKIQPVHPKGNQSWMFIERTDVEAKTPILWPPDVKSWLIWKDPDAGKYWRWEEKGTTEDEMVGWHHWFNGHMSLSKLQETLSRWWSGRPGMLQSMGSQRVGHNWETELNWIFFKIYVFKQTSSLATAGFIGEGEKEGLEGSVHGPSFLFLIPVQILHLKSSTHVILSFHR